MTSVASGRVVRVDISEMSGFSYGVVVLQGSNGSMEFRYDMSSKGSIPLIGTYATIKYVEGSNRRILEIRPAPEGTMTAMTAPMSASAIEESVAATMKVPEVVQTASTPATGSSSGGSGSTRRTAGRITPSADSASTLPRRGSSVRGPEIEGGSSAYSPAAPSVTSPIKTLPTRPDGVPLITGLMLIVALLVMLLSFSFSGYPYYYYYSWLSPLLFLGSMFLFVVSIGFYNMKEWARVAVVGLAILISLTIVGLIVSVPLIWYCTRQDIKSVFKK